MATVASPRRHHPGLAPTSADRVLGYASIGLLAIIVTAVIRGRAHWGEVPVLVWTHLAMLLPALMLTPVIMVRRKGVRAHRLMGTIWAFLLIGIAVESFFIPLGGRRFSPIWLLSLFVLVVVPRMILAARRHDVERHRRIARATVIGAFLIAGIFTLPFGRMLGVWLAGG